MDKKAERKFLKMYEAKVENTVIELQGEIKRQEKVRAKIPQK